jgi:hypothetical protein
MAGRELFVWRRSSPAAERLPIVLSSQSFGKIKPAPDAAPVEQRNQNHREETYKETNYLWIGPQHEVSYAHKFNMS